MTEIYANVRDDVKKIGELAWKIALAQNNPADAANFLNNVTNYYTHYYTEEEIEFLRFYFNMKMEMIKNEQNNSDQR